GAGGRAGSGAGVHGRADPAGPRGRALRLLCAVWEDRGDPRPPRLRPRLAPDRWQPAHRDRVGRPLLRDRPRPRPRCRRRRPHSRAHARARRTRATLSGSADLRAAYENAIGTGGINSTSRIKHTHPRTRRPFVSGVTSSSGGVWWKPTTKKSRAAHTNQFSDCVTIPSRMSPPNVRKPTSRW